MNTREQLEDEVITSIREASVLLPASARQVDSAVRMAGFRPLLSVWPPGPEEHSGLLADLIEARVRRKWSAEQAAGRLAVFPCCISAGPEDALVGIALWLEPGQSTETTSPVRQQLDEIGSMVIAQRLGLRRPVT